MVAGPGKQKQGQEPRGKKIRKEDNSSLRSNRIKVYQAISLPYRGSKILFKKWFLGKFTRKYSTTNIPTMMEIFLKNLPGQKDFFFDRVQSYLQGARLCMLFQTSEKEYFLFIWLSGDCITLMIQIGNLNNIEVEYSAKKKSKGK